MIRVSLQRFPMGVRTLGARALAVGALVCTAFVLSACDNPFSPRLEEVERHIAAVLERAPDAAAVKPLPDAALAQPGPPLVAADPFARLASPRCPPDVAAGIAIERLSLQRTRVVDLTPRAVFTGDGEGAHAGRHWAAALGASIGAECARLIEIVPGRVTLRLAGGERRIIRTRR